MKAHLCFVAVLLPLLLSLTINLDRPTDTFRKRNHFDNTLTSDYQHLFAFSKQMKAYGISDESFKKLFLEGAKKSFDFYQSSNRIKRNDINLVLKNLVHRNNLKHGLKTSSWDTSDGHKSSDVLQTFSGEWSGKWQSMSVEHLWLPIRKCNLKIALELELIGFQTCFTGDGFGWNYLIQKGEKTIILGHVYHFNKKRTLDYENPHFALLNGESQLTWVSDNHLYYEFVCENEACAVGKHYVITAIPYSNYDTLKFGAPIQAIYTSMNSVNNSTKIKKPLYSITHHKTRNGR